MATLSSYRRTPAVVLLLLFWTITFLQPGTAQGPQNGILEPEAPKQEPSLWATPLELDFGPVGIGETSSAQVVTVTNTGDAILANFSGGAVPQPFMSTDTCAPGVLPGKSCQYSFWVSPTSAGSFAATTTISTNAGSFDVILHARSTSAGAEFTVTPLSLDFGTVTLTPLETGEDTAADQQIVEVRNVGTAGLSGFSGGNVAQPFEVSNDCPSSLAPGEKCRYYYNFFPTQEGSFNASSTVSTNAGTFTIKLAGKGQASPPFTGQQVTPLELDFGPVGIGNPGSAQKVTLTNLDITQSITGFDIRNLGAPFNLSHNCTPSVSPGGSCTYTYNFAPLAPGAYITTSTTTNSAGTFIITLRGTGVTPQLSASPLVLDFGPVPAGNTSPPQVVTVRNTGSSMATNIVTNNVNPPFSGSQNCTGGLLPGDTCQLTFYYSPTSGVYTDTTTTISANNLPSDIQVTLKGGVKPPQVSKQFVPGTIPVGGVSMLQLTISDPNPAATLFSVAITDTFPAGMVIATPLFFNLSPECGTPLFQPVAGKGSFSLAEGTILGGKTCKIQLNVTAPQPKDYTNTTGNVRSRDGAGGTATATLKVRVFTYIPLISR